MYTYSQAPVKREGRLKRRGMSILGCWSEVLQEGCAARWAPQKPPLGPPKQPLKPPKPS